ncbi:CHAP domain-containing protein [Vannielia litorea]|uniref:CHAP domain-containing protein n=1 Tax=Vannielia litorea TaxID=1217970 RepID=A0A1N6F9N9_9RHOB|nr:CHAP domain-containing protein [Vannielia litorea]SIN91993.1 CHAP domain-containing protein [Vannielia litorea]
MRLARPIRAKALRLPLLCAALLLTAACGAQRNTETLSTMSAPQLKPGLLDYAISEARSLRATGARVWCVPFARNASGVEIRGNANTWWNSASGTYARGRTPQVGAVMAFSGTRQLPMGHVAVVSKVVSDREIEINHANWHRNQISLGMSVIDVSDKNDWSVVKVLSQSNAYGRPYPIDGFIYPTPVSTAI